MKRNSRFLRIMLTAVGILAFQANAGAEIMQGKISLLDTLTQSFGIQRVEPVSKKIDTVNILVLPSTQLKGASSLSEILAGTMVTVDASKNEVSGKWEAKTLEIMKQ